MGFGIHRAVACGSQILHGLGKVFDLKRDVVQTLPPRPEKARQRALLPQRLQEFEQHPSRIHKGETNVLVCQVLAVHRSRAECQRVHLDRGIQAAYCNADVIEPHCPLRISSAAV